eukprot:TRINITY_DN70312_c0_g1_i1.p1 TRINITY_DN70312_c0_g1~~TRINITY_DN70312_c0_g1_i1.p1  ORF type:complete len:262 (-),score=106.13 TRINITY_DN70312_c0_g1_i1:14-772(-)
MNMDDEKKRGGEVDDDGDSDGGVSHAVASVRGKQLPEKILFCVDVDDEMATADLKNKGAKDPVRRLDAVKDAIRIFVTTKRALNPKHEFGLVLLKEDAEMILEPTSQAATFLDHVEQVGTVGSFGAFRFDSLFSIVTPMAPARNAQHVVRVIFIYGRTTVVPTLSGSADTALQTYPVLVHPQFFLDAVYLHRAGREKEPQAVFDAILALDDNAHSGYFFEHAAKLKNVFRSMGVLLAHPLQRDVQDKQSTKI